VYPLGRRIVVREGIVAMAKTIGLQLESMSISTKLCSSLKGLEKRPKGGLRWEIR